MNGHHNLVYKLCCNLKYPQKHCNCYNDQHYSDYAYKTCITKQISISCSKISTYHCSRTHNHKDKIIKVVIYDHKMITVSSEPLFSIAAILFSTLLFSFLVVDRLDQGSSSEEENYFNCVIIANETDSNNKFHRNFLSHEHDFILVRINNSPNWFFKCLTCDICYCKGCGKVLHSKADSTSHQKCN
jgi:hypothetical protein